MSHILKIEMDAAIERYNKAKENGTLDKEFPAIFSSQAPTVEEKGELERNPAFESGVMKNLKDSFTPPVQSEWEKKWWKIWVEFTNHQRTSEEVFALLSKVRAEREHIIGEHNARILNQYQLQGLGDERILWKPIEEATKQTISAINKLN